LIPKPSQDSGYWTLPMRGIDKAQNELTGHKIRVKYFYYDKYSESSCAQANRSMLEDSLDGIIIAPVVSEVCSRFIKKIPEDLPYVFFDSFIPNDHYLAYIGQDSFQSGVLSGRLLHLLVRENCHVAAMRLLPDDYHINTRIDGFLSYFRAYPDIKISVYPVEGNLSRQGLEVFFQEIMSSDTNLKGVFVSNASTHKFAEYLASRSTQDRIHVIGYDLIEDNIKHLKDGNIDFLISQQSEKQGYDALYTLYRHVVLREPVEKNVLMQIDIVNSDNIDYYKS
jgi:LacI family transcriptional regulator